MSRSEDIAERLDRLGRIAYPDLLKQIDMMARINAMSIRGQIERFTSLLPDVTLFHDLVTNYDTAGDRVNEMLRGIADFLPEYPALLSLHAANTETLLESIRNSAATLAEASAAQLSILSSADWGAIIGDWDALRSFLCNLPTEALRNSLLAEAMLAQFDLDRIASRLEGVQSLLPDFRIAHETLIGSYLSLGMDEWTIRGSVFSEPNLALYPSRALLLHCDLVEQVSVLQPVPALSEERVEYLHTTETEDVDELTVLLADVDPRLTDLLSGAELALSDRQDDWSRHFSVSSRELVTHLLWKLAPDDDVRAWTSEERYYHNGHPTRQARTDFVLREMDAGTAREFVESTLSAMLKAHKLLSKGTHSLESRDIETLGPTLLAQLRLSIRLLIRASKGGA